MSLSLETVRKVAQLARLKLTAAEEVEYQKQLSKILDAVEVLKSVNVEGVEPTLHVNLAQSHLREDVQQEPMGVEKALSNAPARVDTHFSVPKIIE